MSGPTNGVVATPRDRDESLARVIRHGYAQQEDDRSRAAYLLSRASEIIGLLDPDRWGNGATTAPPPSLLPAIDALGNRLRERNARLGNLASRNPAGPWTTASTEVSGALGDFEQLEDLAKSALDFREVVEGLRDDTPPPSLRRDDLNTPWRTRSTHSTECDPDDFDIIDDCGECVALAVQGETAEAIVSIVNHVAGSETEVPGSVQLDADHIERIEDALGEIICPADTDEPRSYTDATIRYVVQRMREIRDRDHGILDDRKTVNTAATAAETGGGA